MIKIRIVFTLLISCLLFSGCYVSKKLERDVMVQLDESFIISISNSGNSNFSSQYSEPDYKQAFIEGMKAEFSGSRIILVDENPEFLISISELKIVESTDTETVSDSDSPDNGKVFELTSLSFKATGLVDKIAAERIKDWWADKSKNEKVTNSRSGGQVITGTNKNNTIYREKAFDNDIALDLARKCGRRSGARIINDIIKALK